MNLMKIACGYEALKLIRCSLVDGAILNNKSRFTDQKKIGLAAKFKITKSILSIRLTLSNNFSFLRDLLKIINLIFLEMKAFTFYF